jgi:hypothetical protein
MGAGGDDRPGQEGMSNAEKMLAFEKMSAIIMTIPC